MSDTTSEAAHRSGLDLGQYAYIVKRQWRVVAAAAVIGILVSVGYLLILAPEYTATTDVRLNVISANPFSHDHPASALLDDQTETQIAGSYAVAEAAAKDLNGDISASTLRSGATITASAGASVVHVRFSAPTAKEATRGADAVAKAYLDYRAMAARDQISRILGKVTISLSDLQNKLARVNARPAASPKNQLVDDQTTIDRNLIVTEINGVLAQKNGLEQVDTSGGSELTASADNEVVQAPNTSITLIAGLLAGAVVGLLAAFPVNYFDRKIRNAREVDRLFGPLVLGNVTSSNASLPEGGATLELLKSARERLLSRIGADVRSMVVFDDTPGPDGSDIPANMALLVAQSGRGTQLLIAVPSPETRTILKTHLGLIRTAGDKNGTLFRSKLSPDLSVYLPAGTNSGMDITPTIKAQLEAAPESQLVMLVLPPRSPQSTRLAAERISDAAVIVIATNASRTDHVDIVFNELAATEAHFLGTITVPHDRALLLAAVAPED